MVILSVAGRGGRLEQWTVAKPLMLVFIMQALTATDVNLVVPQYGDLIAYRPHNTLLDKADKSSQVFFLR